jgi:hypothetical protein
MKDHRVFLPMTDHRVFLPAEYRELLAKYRARDQVPRDLTDRAAKNAHRAARRAGKPITWSEARQRARAWNHLCGRR